MSQPGPRLLAIHPGALGDVILMGHLLAHLRTPDTRIALAAGAEKARLLTSLGVIDEPLDIDSAPLHELFVDPPTDGSGLSRRLGSCDRLISCFAGGDPAARRRLVAACGAHRADFLKVRPDSTDRRHLLTVWADQLDLTPPRPIPVRQWPVPPEIQAGAAERLGADGVDASRGFVAMHVGSGSPAKCWPPDRFAQLAEGLALPVVLLAGPVERERLSAGDAQRLRQAGTLIEGLSLAHLAGVLAAATAFVGNDSGPAHLAAAVGTPVVALFGPTDPVQFAPRSRSGADVGLICHDPLGHLPAEAVAAKLADYLPA